MLINEQIRHYNEKMEEIEQLEYAEALAVNELKLKRQNTVRRCPRWPEELTGHRHPHRPQWGPRNTRHSHR